MIAAFRLVLACLIMLVSQPTQAQDADAPIQRLLQVHGEVIVKSSRKTIQPAIDALAASGLPDAREVLNRWREKEMWVSKETGLFVFAEKAPEKQLLLFDVAGGAEIGLAEANAYKQLKPNSGIRGLISAALVQFQLSDPSPAFRLAALNAIERDPDASHLSALRAVMDSETQPNLKARIERLERLLTIQFDEDNKARIAAINGFEDDLGVDFRAVLNPLVATRIDVAEALPEGAQQVEIGSDMLPAEIAYDMLVAKELAAPRVTPDMLRAALIENIDGATVAGVQVATLYTDEARQTAYAKLARNGTVPPIISDGEVSQTLEQFVFFQTFTGAPPAVALAAQAALLDIETKLALSQTADLALDALSLASIYFLAAIGLAITFGVMGVINMAHGEFIMMGAYTGYVVQLFVPDHTISILLAIPLAFAVTFSAGVAMERLVIRWLYNRR